MKLRFLQITHFLYFTTFRFFFGGDSDIYLEKLIFRGILFCKKMASLSTSSQDSNQVVSNMAQTNEPVRCPITFKELHEIAQPVFLTADGYIYERSAILQWLSAHGNSPVNRARASSADIKNVYATLRQSSSAPTPNPVSKILILTIDVSSSMRNPVTVKVKATNGGTTEVSHGLSRADVALHSAKSVVNAATENVVIGIVTFGTGASEAFLPTIMNSKGKQDALAALNDIRINGSTYLNDGIRCSLTMSDQAGCYYPDAAKHIWIFSDGEPMEPTNNHVQNLKTYQINRMASAKAYNLLKAGCDKADVKSQVASYRTSLYDSDDPITEWSISTFAYGTECDSNLLWQISDQGNGSFGFIPDAGWVETVFTHFFANLLLSTPVTLTSAEDQKRMAFITVLEKIVDVIPHGVIQSSPYVTPVPREITDADLAAAKELYQQYLQASVGIWCGKDEDGFDQVSIALTRNSEGIPFWKDWGRPYVKGLIGALRRMECTNKRDPCLQRFCRGQEWFDTRDKITSLFCEMPPPIPSSSHKRKRRSRNSSSSSSSRNRSQSPAPPPLGPPDMMRSYSQAVCFHADTMVTLSSGLETECRKLVPGDRLVTCKIMQGDNQREYLVRSTDEIEYIVKTQVTTPKLCKLVSEHSRQVVAAETALFVTPWHPVAPEICLMAEGDKALHKPDTWEFPFRIGSVIAPEHPKCEGTDESGTQYVYSFLMKERSAGILCDSFWSITLAHGIDFGTAKHDFWGTEAVVESLKPFVTDGIAFIKPSNIQRNVSDEVVGFD